VGSVTNKYDPFLRGYFPVGVRTIDARDPVRNRLFPCEIWYPASHHHAGQDTTAESQDSFTVPFPPQSKPRSQMAVRNAAARPGMYPLVLFSHSSGGGRRQSTFLCTHLSSHGYLVAALDHSEIVAAELAAKADETPEQKAARAEAWIANRMPDVRFLLDHVLSTAGSGWEPDVDPAQIGIVGHSFGGWTALAAPEVDRRIRAVVALAPAGASQRKPGIIPVRLTFNWGRNVPTLYLVAEDDTALPLAGMYELFERTPATKQMLILRRADHCHFMDNIEELHETVRKMPFPGTDQMRPIADLSSGEQAYLFVRGLTLAHLDATLKQDAGAQRFLAADLESELRNRAVDVIAHKP
jgi:predicted dienelactone hydrolase